MDFGALPKQLDLVGGTPDHGGDDPYGPFQAKPLGFHYFAAILKNKQFQAKIQAEGEAAGGVTPLQRCWTHPKPQELGSEKSELNCNGKEIQTSPGCVHSGYSFFNSALQSRNNDAVIIRAWLCL